MDNETVDKILSIFEPYWKQQRKSLLNSKSRFVHYTSADSAIKIIQTKSIWMRNARCMNDYKEISYGHELLLNAFIHELGKANVKDAASRVIVSGIPLRT
jgi:hypothetical protein